MTRPVRLRARWPRQPDFPVRAKDGALDAEQRAEGADERRCEADRPTSKSQGARPQTEEEDDMRRWLEG